jgi:hypothetical protein
VFTIKLFDIQCIPIHIDLITRSNVHALEATCARDRVRIANLELESPITAMRGQLTPNPA